MAGSDIIWEVAKIFLLYFSWWVIPAVTIFVYKKKLMKYPIDVVIYEKRGENLIKTNDVCGRFEDPIVCYRLKLSKDSIPIPNYDWVLQCVQRPTNLLEKIPNMLCGKIGTITLFKYGSKQYKPINVKLDSGKVVQKFKELKDAHGNDIIVTVYEPLDVRGSMNKLEFNIIDWDDINHMTQELRAIALRRSPIQKFLEKYGWLLGLVIAALVFIIAIYYGYQLMMDAGNRYIDATKQVSGYGNTPSSTNTETQKATVGDTPLGGLIPGA